MWEALFGNTEETDDAQPESKQERHYGQPQEQVRPGFEHRRQYGQPQVQQVRPGQYSAYGGPTMGRPGQGAYGEGVRGQAYGGAALSPRIAMMPSGQGAYGQGVYAGGHAGVAPTRPYGQVVSGGFVPRRDYAFPKFQGDPNATKGGTTKGQLAVLRAKAAEIVEQGRKRISSAKKRSMGIASNPQNQVVAASGLGGAVVVGAGGAGVGLLTGGATGAAIGLLPALFTFGLSIPFGMVIGGACGTVVGAAAGGTIGGTGGSAVGYVAFKKRRDIKRFFSRFNLKLIGARAAIRRAIRSAIENTGSTATAMVDQSGLSKMPRDAPKSATVFSTQRRLIGA